MSECIAINTPDYLSSITKKFGDVAVQLSANPYDVPVAVCIDTEDDTTKRIRNLEFQYASGEEKKEVLPFGSFKVRIGKSSKKIYSIYFTFDDPSVQNVSHLLNELFEKLNKNDKHKVNLRSFFNREITKAITLQLLVPSREHFATRAAQDTRR